MGTRGLRSVRESVLAAVAWLLLPGLVSRPVCRTLAGTAALLSALTLNVATALAHAPPLEEACCEPWRPAAPPAATDAHPPSHAPPLPALGPAATANRSAGPPKQSDSQRPPAPPSTATATRRCHNSVCSTTPQRRGPAQPRGYLPRPSRGRHHACVVVRGAVGCAPGGRVGCAGHGRA